MFVGFKKSINLAENLIVKLWKGASIDQFIGQSITCVVGQSIHRKIETTPKWHK